MNYRTQKPIRYRVLEGVGAVLVYIIGFVVGNVLGLFKWTLGVIRYPVMVALGLWLCLAVLNHWNLLP